VQGKAIETIGGLSYKKDGKQIHNPPTGRIADLDSLPMPAYHLLRMNAYHPPEGLYRRLPAINIITARGCPNLCTYCATHTIWGGKLKFRSVDNIIDEIRYLVDRFGIKEISISDDTFTLSKSRIIEFCEKIMIHGIDLTWTCNSRVENIDEEALRWMKKAGCHHICYGVESADPQILKNINKNIMLDKAKAVIQITKKVGITCRASFMFGNPGETRETMRKTLDFVINANPDFAVFNVTTPYPGTPMYAWAKKNGYLMDEDWDTFHGSKAHIRLPTIAPEEIEQFQQYAFKKFYVRPRYLLGRIIKIRMHDIKLYARAIKSLLKL
jgi:anaerobic magnesium-protoporphyrin IX monomethyl ester cyclase